MPLEPENHIKTPGDNPGGGPIGLIIAFILVAVAVIVVYSVSMHGPFVLDDEFIIVKNPRAHSILTLWPPYDPRFVGYLSIAINYMLGGINTFGYHVVNVAIHIINGVLVYLLVISLFRCARSAGYDSAPAGTRGDPMVPLAITSALLFIVHPINTQAVTYIVQRFASLATLFYLLSIVLYLEWRRARVRGGAKGASVALYILALASAAAAQKTKEIAFTLPFVIVLLEFAVVGAGEDERIGRRILWLIPFLATLALIPLSMLATELSRPVPAAAAKAVGKAAARPALASRLVPTDLKQISPHDYLVTQFRVLITYLRLMVLPIGQNLEYDYPVFRSVLSPQPLASLVFHLCAFFGAVYLYVRARAARNLLALLISFGVVFFYMTISIESSVIPLRDIVFEHRMYLPGIGLFISFSAAFFYVWGRARGSADANARTAAIVLLCVTALPLAYASFTRNLVWSDKIALYEDTARKSPGSFRARNNLGVEYASRGMYDRAIPEFEASLRAKPDLLETYKNLANAYYQSGGLDRAISVYTEVLKMAPKDKVARKNLADIYYEAGLVQSAIKEYRTVLSMYPGYVNVRNNLANILLSEGRLGEAISEYERVLSTSPGHAEALYNVAIALEKAGKMNKAAYYYKKFLDAAPPEYQAYKDDVRGRLEKMQKR